jgi:hypothetical protein
LSKQLLNLNKFSLKSRDPILRDKKSLEIMEQVDYNFSKSEKAKGTQKRAAIGNQVFDTDFQCCLTHRISCTIVSNRQDACSTKDKFSCGTGILPVHKRLIDNRSHILHHCQPQARCLFHKR